MTKESRETCPLHRRCLTSLSNLRRVLPARHKATEFPEQNVRSRLNSPSCPRPSTPCLASPWRFREEQSSRGRLLAQSEKTSWPLRTLDEKVNDLHVDESCKGFTRSSLGGKSLYKFMHCAFLSISTCFPLNLQGFILCLIIMEC